MNTVVVWISEDTWEACVREANRLLPADAEVTLLHVAPTDVEELAAGPGFLGRHRPPPGPPLRAIAEEEAQALLAAAAEQLERPARLESRRGQVERELLEACHDADLLLMARDGELRPGPKSIGRRERFVLDHVACRVLLVWPQTPPPLERRRLPPHLRD